MATKTTTSTNTIKKFLRQQYGLKKASVRSGSGANTSSLNITYTAGPDPARVKAQFSRLADGKFDGMTDSYDYKAQAERGMSINGTELQTYKFVFVRREFPAELKLEACRWYWEFTKFEGGFEPTADRMAEYFTNRWGSAWRWYDIAHQILGGTNWPADLTGWSIVGIDRGADCYENEVVFLLLHQDGGVHRTDELWTPPLQRSAAALKPDPVIKRNGVRLVDYSEKAVAVVGDTYEIKEQLKEAGGRFNRGLTVDGQKTAGWVFSKRHQDAIANLLIDYSAQ